jgi:hypothetical protein
LVYDVVVASNRGVSFCVSRTIWSAVFYKRTRSDDEPNATYEDNYDTEKKIDVMCKASVMMHVKKVVS